MTLHVVNLAKLRQRSQNPILTRPGRIHQSHTLSTHAISCFHPHRSLAISTYTVSLFHAAALVGQVMEYNTSAYVEHFQRPGMQWPTPGSAADRRAKPYLSSFGR